MRWLAASVLTPALLVAVGCGNERTGSGSLFNVPARTVTQTLHYPGAGLTVRVPKEFSVKPATAPELFRASGDEAFVSSFAYRRTEQIPKGGADLDAARGRLVDTAKRRDKTFRLRSSRLTRAADAPAIELLGDQTIFKGRLRLRSLHVFKGNGEYVIELVALVGAFGRLDRASFPDIRRSLRITGEVKEPKRAGEKPAGKSAPGSSSPGATD